MTFAKTALFIALSASLSACGAFGTKDAEFVEQGAVERDVDVRTGPDTKQLLKTIPKGLLADTQNVRHSYETLKGEDNTN